jgi:putative oxidoreductase
MQITSTDPVKSSATVRRFAFALLWLAAIAQAIWMLFHHFRLQESWGSMWYPLTLAAPFLLLALTGGRVHWFASILRLPLAFAFLDAVADRLGLLGPFGTAGVAWGDFRHFIDYTAQINPFLPSAVIPAVAVLATICEISFGLGLLLGVKIRFVALGSAALLFLFGTAMTTSGLSQFAYGVYLMAAGALALSTVDASLLSVDSLLRWRKKKS